MLALCCATVFSGCSGEGIRPEDAASQIQFATPDNWGDDSATRTVSDDSGTSFIVGDKIGVYAYYTQAGTDGWAEFMMNEDVLKESSSWTYSPVKYWPANTNDKISFYGYYPYTEGQTNPEAIEIDDAVTDWLWATPVTNQKSGTVNLLFHHALAGIRIKVTCSDEMSDPVMKGAALTDSKSLLPYGGTLNLGTADATKAGDVTPAENRVGRIDFPFGQAEYVLSETPVSSCIYIPTHSGITDGQISLSFVFNIDGFDEEVSYILPLTGTSSYEAGTLYTYNLFLDVDKALYITSITIDDFEVEEPSSVIMGRRDVLIGDTYYVATAEYLKSVANEINADPSLNNRNITLIDDIDLKGEDWTPLGVGEGYGGTFEGNGHQIKGLNVSTPVVTKNLYSTPDKTDDAEYECAALIGYLNENGTAKNIILTEGVNIDVTGLKKNADLHAAGIAGTSSGVIENCHLYGTTNIKVTAYSGVANTNNYDGRIGGIAALLNGGSIIGCSVTGEFTARVYGNTFNLIGGIVSYTILNSNIIGCYVDGKIDISAEAKFAGKDVHIGGVMGVTGSPGNFCGCYFRGDDQSRIEVTGSLSYTNSNTGAIVGQISGITTDNCYWEESSNITKGVSNPVSVAEIIKVTDLQDAVNEMNSSLSTISATVPCRWRYQLNKGKVILIPYNE